MDFTSDRGGTRVDRFRVDASRGEVVVPTVRVLAAPRGFPRE